ncbi:MAG: PBP1A family penicillin-binding protein [Alphaproteobacteria bacterium]
MTQSSPEKGQDGRKSSGRKPEAPKARRRARHSLVGTLFFWGAIAAVWGVVFAVGVVAYYAQDLPDINTLATPARQPSITVLAADGSTIATIGNQYGEYVDVKNMPKYLPEAVVATEDRRFYQHFGVDFRGLARAVVANLRAGEIVQGGSTITQQLAKNLFLSPERTLKRKIQESLLALWLEHRFTKDQILTIYLNRVYLGAGSYGVDAAARRYFNKSARDVTLYESAVLAGLLKAPSRFAPTHATDLTEARTEQVLNRMVDTHFITAAEAKKASAGGAAYAKNDGTDSGTRYFVDWIVDQTDSFTGGINRDLVVKTSLDPKLQRIAEAKVKDTLGGAAKDAGVSEGAMVVLTPDGAVKAMVGGRDYGTSQFNRVTQALRQPGSSFKLFVYLAALESGMHPFDTVLDAPISIRNWSPGNFDDKYAGEITLTQALSESRNTAAVRIAQRVGVPHIIEMAQRLGITSSLQPNLSIALGTSEVTLVELTSAYATLANDGIGVWSYGITEIRDWQGQVLYRRSGSGPGRLLDKPVVAEIVPMLERVITDGTGKAAAIDRPAAGKTGTSQGFRDAWFIGYNTDLIAGIWMGNDNEAPMQHVTGGRVPAKLWHDFMIEALAGMPARPLPGLEAPPAQELPQAPMARAAPPAAEQASATEPMSPEQAAAYDHLHRNPGAGFWDQVMQNIGIR